MRPLVIYHGNCADGFSAAWVVWKRFGGQADFVPGVYQTAPPDVTGRDVILVDFSYKRPVIETMLQQARSVTFIDHHKSAIEDLAGLSEHFENFFHFTDLNRSGATLAWDYFFSSHDRPLLLGHVEDRDLWRFKLAGTREIQAAVFSYEYTFENWDRLMNADQVELMKLTANGAAIERKHHKDIAELLAVCQRDMTIAGHEVPVASLPYTMVSDAAGLMAKGKPFAACYYDTSTARKFGLRSTDEGLDVSVIAAQYGGGGHRNAAGFSVPRDHILARS